MYGVIGCTYVTASLDDPDLLLDLVIAHTQLFLAVGTDEIALLFWTPCKAFWCLWWSFVSCWWRLCSRSWFNAHVKRYHIKVEQSWCRKANMDMTSCAWRTSWWRDWSLAEIGDCVVDLGVEAVNLRPQMSEAAAHIAKQINCA
jgi:hypothetical protein